MSFLYRVDPCSNLSSIAREGLRYGSYDRMGLSDKEHRKIYNEPDLPIGLPLESALAKVKSLPIPPPDQIACDRLYFFNEESRVINSKNWFAGKTAPIFGCLDSSSRVSIRIRYASLGDDLIYPDGCFMIDDSGQCTASYHVSTNGKTHLKANIEIYTSWGWSPLPAYVILREFLGKI